MKNNINNIGILLIIIGLSIGCKKEYINPNNPTDGEILNSREGLITLSIGMKQNYATTAIEALYINSGVTSRELKGTSTLQNVAELEAGGTLGSVFLNSGTGNVAQVWNRMFKVMGMAENIIDKSPTVLADYPQLKSGIVAHAQIFKALSIGGLAVTFEKFPIQTNQDGNATFVTREVALQTALDLLSQAKSNITSVAPSADFDTRVLGNTSSIINFSMINVINALTARYSLWLKKYTDAYNAANIVNLTIKSQFIYTTSGQNPLYAASTLPGLTAAYRPREYFGLTGSLLTTADSRFTFYTTGTPVLVSGENVKILAGFFNINNPIPVYLPDEMKLIKAEAILMSATPIAGTTIPSSVIAEIDAVRTQASGDIFGVNANLPTYSGATDAASLAAEIYKQRCMELFCTGNRLEDSRRLGRIASPTNLVERNRNFYPYPDQERQNNPNTPTDPAF
jgi:starch-binding outer membrane protein, SusD/RagB family